MRNCCLWFGSLFENTETGYTPLETEEHLDTQEVDWDQCSVSTQDS